MRALAILTVRNEGAFLIEWLAHHMACGFADFLVFSNDCSDGTDRMLDRLAQMGHLTHRRNDGPYHKRGIQFTALQQADRSDAVRQADWLLPLDVDEFVNIHVGDRTLTALWAELPEATAITLTWRLFGNGGVVRFKDAPVTRQFTACAPQDLTWPWRASMFKTLYRNDGTYGKTGVHRPRSPDRARLDGARWYDGSGRALPAQFRTGRIFSDYRHSNHDLVQLNHYPLGAMESYLLKSDRGRAVHESDRLGMDYWVERNLNTCNDTSIHALAPQSDAIRAALMDDAHLADLHRQAVAWRHARFSELMLDEPRRALFARLQMTPQSQPLSSAQAEEIFGYGHRARNLATD